MVAKAFERYRDRPCFGEAASDRSATYADVWARVVRVASALVKEGVRRGDIVALAGSASPQWVIADLACLMLGAISAPLQTTTSIDDIVVMLEQTKPICVVVGAGTAPACAAALRRCAHEPRLVLTERDGIEVVAAARPSVTTRLFSDFEAGASSSIEHVARRADDDIFTIVFTSGSTGTPKGVRIVERRWAATLRRVLKRVGQGPQIALAYLPLSHMAGRTALYSTLLLGGVSYFASRPDASTLFEDIRSVRPTTLTLVPRVSGVAYAHFRSEVLRRGGASALASGIDGPIATAVIDEMRDTFFGDRLCHASTTAAPTQPEVSAFLERCFGIVVMDVYGCTELGRIAIDGVIEPWFEHELIDVPELGYTNADVPHPRGELALKSAYGTPMYQDGSTPPLTSRGFVLTGDIFENRDGRLRWLDRKNAIVKLAHGTFVNVSRIEERLVASSPFVAQAYVFADSALPHVLAVIVPARDVLAVHGVNPDDDAEVKTFLRSEIDRAARESSFASYEIPRDFVIDRAGFTLENGGLTESNKPRRAVLRARFEGALRKLQAEIERRQLPSNNEPIGETSLEALLSAVSVTLGVALPTIDVNASFAAVGGDSMAAMSLTSTLERRIGKRLEVGSVLDPTLSLTELARRMEQAPSRGTFEELHGEAEHAEATAYTAARLLGEVKPLLAAKGKPPNVVLVTGGTGFLGRYLVLDLLERLAPTSGRVVALVRSANDDAARERLTRAFEGSASLSARFARAAQATELVVHAGDLATGAFGLARTDYARLAREVDAIVHAGALVNHALLYRELFAPNVGGTIEIARLAMEERAKPVHFVSTVAVADDHMNDVVYEIDDARRLAERRRIDDAGIARGYATSKWACEIFLADVATSFDVPITIYRCGTMLPHRDHPDVLNEGDTFTRLLYGVLKTGVAPVSFQAHDRERSSAPPLPVDVVSSVITELACRAPRAPSLRTFHVAGDDDVTLDTFIDEAIALGHPLERLTYEAWYAEFSRRLEELPEDEQRRAPAALLARFRTRRDGGLPRFDSSRLRAELDDARRLDGAATPELVRACVQSVARRG